MEQRQLGVVATTHGKPPRVDPESIARAQWHYNTAFFSTLLEAGLEYAAELVIVFDEFDRLQPPDRLQLADTIKELSDNGMAATVVMVGVAKDITGLITDHASIDRCLAQIKMPPMTRLEVQEILNKGLDHLNMTMAAEAGDTIVTLAQGYPHYAHLLGKHAAMNAICRRSTAVNTTDVTAAIKESLNDVGYNIPDDFHKATMAQRKGTLFESVLLACAMANVDDLGFFSSTDVKLALNAITDKQYEIYGFSQHLQRFASDAARGPVLEKRGSSRCYQYRFLNPLLRPYAITKGMSDGVVTIDMLQRLGKPVKKKPARAPRLIPTPKKVPDGGLFEGL